MFGKLRSRLGSRKQKQRQRNHRKRIRRLRMEPLERRLLLATNIGAVRPSSTDPFLLLQLLDTEPLTGPRNPADEIRFQYGHSSATPGGVGLDDVALTGDLSGIGFDQAITVRQIGGALQFLGDTDRDTDQEYLFRFGLSSFTPFIADMNGDGHDDIITVDTDTASDLLEWYVHLWDSSGATDYFSDIVVPISTTFSFGVDSDHPAAVAGVDDIPQVGDFNNDGRSDAVVARNDTALYDWFVSYSDATGTADANANLTINNYGANNDVPVVGNWDNLGGDNIGVVDEDTPISTWNLDTNGGGAAEIGLQYGLPGDQYVVGSWADRYWDGTGNAGGDGVNWHDPLNWSGNTLPAAGEDVLIFQPNANPTITHSAGSNSTGKLISTEAISVTGGILAASDAIQSTQSISVNAGTLQLDQPLDTPQLNLSSGILEINADNVLGASSLHITGGVIRSLNAARELSNAVTLAGDLSIGGQPLTLRGYITISGATRTVAPSNNTTVSGPISGSFGLTTTGGGTLELSAANTYTGTTRIEGGGTLLITGSVSGDTVLDLGRLEIGNNAALGSGTLTITGTTLGTVLATSGGSRSIGNSVNLSGGFTGGFSSGPLTITGPTTLVGGTRTINFGSGLLTMAGPIGDGGNNHGIIKSGGSTLELSGANTYGGATTIQSGRLDLAASGVIPDSSVVSVDPVAIFDLRTFDDIVAGLSGSGSVRVDGGTLTVAGSGSSTYDGVFSGTGEFEVAGPGTQTLTGNSTYTGGTTVSGGTLVVDGSLASSVVVQSGGRLAGSGTVNASVTALSGGTVAPGNSPEIINTGDFDLQAGSSLEIELGGLGANPGTDYDQVNVTGTVTLAGDLDLLLISNLTAGQTYTIVNNDLTDAVSGTFAGLAEGATVSFGPSDFIISYVGGTGNDVVLTSQDTTFVVTNTLDSGASSLRQAMLNANATANGAGGADLIVFNILGSGPHSIAPIGALPTITEAVIVDGYSEPGASPNTLAAGNDAVLMIELDGTTGGTNGLTITASGSTVRGLLINRFDTVGIRLDGANAFGNVVEGNFLGTNVTGTASLGNGVGQPGAGAGVEINEASNNTIGGTTAAARNLLSGNLGQGIRIGRGFVAGIDSSGNSVQGNFIGTDVTGTVSLSNTRSGVNLSIGAINNTIGGTSPAARNVISGNANNGVLISSNNASGNLIQGNFIGTDVGGTTPLGNSAGLRIDGPNNTIGGTDPGAGNVISGNTSGLILFAGDMVVQGNFIGTDLTGTVNLGNGFTGIVIATSNNTIGGTAAGAGNTIAFNGAVSPSPGVRVIDNVTGNAILSNSIYLNNGLGIDLAASDAGGGIVTPNDAGDTDVGSNNLQNFPVLSAAVNTGSNTVVQGTLNSVASTNFDIEFFSSTAGDPSGFGEGETFLGSTSVSTDTGGDATFAVALPTSVPVGHVVTATATDPNGNTSEFSATESVVLVSDDITYRTQLGGSNFVLGDTVTWQVFAELSNATTNFGAHTVSFDMLLSESGVDLSTRSIGAPFADYSLPSTGVASLSNLMNVGAG